jgi:hypothetical protein
MVESGETVNPYFARILLARQIYTASGGAVIAPWQIEELPEVWLDAFRVWNTDGKRLAEIKQIVAAKKQAWVNRFRHYRQ